MWLCRCDCGNLITVSTTQLKTGNRKSCNCLSKPPVKKWIGSRFGKLTVIKYDGKRGGRHYWLCRCDCGKEKIVSQSNLKAGHTISCGCMVDPCRSRHFVDGTCIEQIRSRKIFSNNTSGVRGVYKNRRSNKWVAQITFQGKTRYLGAYSTLDEAAEARKSSEELFDDCIKRYEAGEFDRDALLRAPAFDAGKREGAEL